MAASIRVIIADDDEALRDILGEVVADEPTVELVGSAADSGQAVRLCEELRPDVVLLDIRMPGGGGLRVAQEIRERSLPTRIVGLSAFAEPAYVREMFRLGACGYVTKGASAEEIVEAVKRAARGQMSVSMDLATSAFGDSLNSTHLEGQRRAAARDADREIRALLDAVPAGLVAFDPEGNIRMANASAATMFRCDRDAMLGRAIDTLVPHPLGLRPVAEPASNATLAEVDMTSAVTALATRDDGASFTCTVAVNDFPDGSGLRLALLEERPPVVEQVRAREEQFRRAMDSSPDGILIVDAEGRIELTNPQLQVMFGYTAEQLLGQPVEILLPEAVRPAHIAHRGRYRTNPQSRSMGLGLDLIGLRRDGSKLSVDISLAPLPSPEGILTIARVRDVTDRRRAERRLMLAELVRLLEDERLRLAADIHDDTIQAITVASLRLERMRQRVGDDDLGDELTKVESSVHSAISRLRHLMFDLRPPALSTEGLTRCVRVCVEQFQSDTGIRVEFRSEMVDDPPLDTSVLLYRTLQELLMNIRKHSGARSALVEISDADGGYQLRITDDGQGFDLARLETPVGHLGLTAVAERARNIGGRCHIESEPGHGATVTFWVPSVDPRHTC